MMTPEHRHPACLKSPYRVALLTNFVPPYRLPVFLVLQSGLKELSVFVSTVMEPNRAWPAEWEGLNVIIQRSFTLRRTWRHPQGFSEPTYIHVPYDTLLRLARCRPDVVISAEMGLRTLQAALYRRLHPTSRLIVWATLSEHTEQARGRLRERLRRWILHQADAVLVNGESGARYIHRFGVPDERVFRVPQASCMSALSPVALAREPADAYRLLYAGRLVELKGLAPFLSVLWRWASAHPQRPLEFWLAGDGPERPKLERFRLPPSVTLRFLGHVPYPELPKVYARAGILAFPTLSDEWGLVTNEAMFAGLPVLGSLYSQAVEELVREGVTGWLFRPDQPEEVYAALDRALNTPSSVLEQMRIKAREVAAAITPEAMADRILQAIDWCFR